MPKYVFVKTSDAKCAELLRKAGYPEIGFQEGKYVFINSPLTSIPFTAADKCVEFSSELYT